MLLSCNSTWLMLWIKNTIYKTSRPYNKPYKSHNNNQCFWRKITPCSWKKRYSETNVTLVKNSESITHTGFRIWYPQVHDFVRHRVVHTAVYLQSSIDGWEKYQYHCIHSHMRLPFLHRATVATKLGVTINPLTAKLFNSNFHPLKVVSRWRDPQLQVSENYSDLTKWRSSLFKSYWLMSHFISNIFKMWYLMC